MSNPLHSPFGSAEGCLRSLQIAALCRLASCARMDGSWFTIALVVGAYLLAGFVKGVMGMGLPQVSLGILASVMTPAQAAAILIAPSFATNVWQMVTGPHLFALARRLGGMLVGLFVGAWLGAGILTGSNAKPAALGLGLVLVLYALMGLAKIKFSVPRRTEVWLGPLVGLATGYVMAATGVFVVPALPYLQAIGLEKDELVQALGLHFTLSTLALTFVLWGGDAFDTSLGLLSLLAIAPAVVGMYFGQHIRRRISVETFRLCFFTGILLIGLQLAWRNL